MCGTIDDCLNCQHEECLCPDVIFDFEVDISRQNERQAVLLHPTKYFQHEVYNKRWKQENRSHVSAYNKKYREEHKEYYRDHQKKYADRYRPIKRGKTGNITRKIWRSSVPGTEKDMQKIGKKFLREIEHIEKKTKRP